MRLREPHAARVLDDVVAGVLAVDLEAPAEAMADREQRVVVLGRARVDLRAEPLVRDRGIGAGDEGGDLAVADLTVAVGVGGAVEARTHLVTEDAGLEAVPFVALAMRRAGEKETDARIVAEPMDVAQRLRGTTLAAGTARIRDEVRVTRVDDEVEVIGADLGDNLGREILAGEARVLEPEITLTVAHAAVARVEEIEHRLDMPRTRLGDVGSGMRERQIELGEARRLGLGSCLRMKPRGVGIGTREQIRPRAEEPEEIDVPRGVVVGVLERGQLGVDRHVRADHEREDGALAGLRRVVGVARGRPHRRDRDHRGERQREMDAAGDAAQGSTSNRMVRSMLPGPKVGVFPMGALEIWPSTAFTVSGTSVKTAWISSSLPSRSCLIASGRDCAPGAIGMELGSSFGSLQPG